MTAFVIEDSFWNIFPDAEIGVLIVRGVDNSPNGNAAIAAMLADAHTDAHRHVPHETWTDNPVVSRWRSAFQQFKTRKGARSSIEALLKRVSNGNTIGSISPLVDIYNAISLTYGTPIGGEDLASIQGDIRLGLAKGGESFRPLGSDEDEPALPGELIYADDAGAICRCWNWREAERTMLTESTTDCVMVLEAVDKTTGDQLSLATNALAGALREHLGADVHVHMLDKANPGMELS